MFEAFPWMGVGQGNFYRLSTILELTQSNWLANSIGNNAHNYFLQTLAETGLIGFGAFLFVFAWPYFHTENTKKLVPATLLILSVFLGNIYSHSLLIRDNLFLLATFVALLYAYTNTSVQAAVNSQRNYLIQKKYGAYAAIILLSAVIFFVVTEVSASFYKMPFEYAGHCYQGAKETKKCDVRK
jgi:O-antigen ligase